jgi:hypothetical protein
MTGYRNPPIETRFPPGVSGNRRGRPKRVRSLVTDVLQGMKATAVHDGRKMSHQRAIAKNIVKAAVDDVRTPCRFGHCCRECRRWRLRT